MTLRPLALVIVLASVSAAGLAAGQDWNRADIATRRLPPAAVRNIPEPIQRELDRRRCTIPQPFGAKEPQNVVRGRFTSASQIDIAVLCSRDRISSILVFRGGSPGSVAELATRPDRNYLQVVEVPDVVGFSRALGVANPKYIRGDYQEHGGPKPPRLDHDGIDDAFVEKGSVVWYWSAGRWLQLTGAD